MKPLKDIVAELVLLEAQATAGPWSTDFTDVWAGVDPDDSLILDGVGSGNAKANAAFVAAVRNAFPEIVKGIDELTAERDAAREAALEEAAKLLDTLMNGLDRGVVVFNPKTQLGDAARAIRKLKGHLKLVEGT